MPKLSIVGSEDLEYKSTKLSEAEKSINKIGNLEAKRDPENNLVMIVTFKAGDEKSHFCKIRYGRSQSGKIGYWITFNDPNFCNDDNYNLLEKALRANCYFDLVQSKPHI